MTAPRTHPNGVVIPPDEGDPNHPGDSLGAWMPREGAWTGTGDADGSGLVSQGPDPTDGHTEAPDDELTDEDRELISLMDDAIYDLLPLHQTETAMKVLRALLPVVTTYGDQREKAGAEKALREAAEFCARESAKWATRFGRYHEESADYDARAITWEAAGDECTARADEIGGRA